MSKVVRSPRYPGVSLGEALLKVGAVYAKEHRHPADREVVARSLGYGGLNGASLTTISALIKYGFLEPIGSQLKVTERAETILLLTKGHPDRASAVREAAFAPDLFSELRNSFGDNLPSDENLRFSLIKKGFNPKAVDVVIRAYRDTLGFVNEEESLNLSGNQSPPEMQTQHEELMQPQHVDRSNNKSSANIDSGQAFAENDAFGQTLIHRISEECKARVQFDGPVTQEAIRKLVAFLELGADVYPSKTQKQLTIPPIEQAVVQEDLWNEQ